MREGDEVQESPATEAEVHAEQAAAAVEAEQAHDAAETSQDDEAAAPPSEG